MPLFAGAVNMQPHFFAGLFFLKMLPFVPQKGVFLSGFVIWGYSSTGLLDIAVAIFEGETHFFIMDLHVCHGIAYRFRGDDMQTVIMGLLTVARNMILTAILKQLWSWAVAQWHFFMG